MLGKQKNEMENSFSDMIIGHKRAKNEKSNPFTWQYTGVYTMASEQLIPLCEHWLWPCFRDAGYESSDLVLKNWGSALNSDDKVQIPDTHDVYMFKTENTTFTWYRHSNLVAHDGVLYHVFHEHNNLLGSYAWLAKQPRRSEYLVVNNCALRCTLKAGILIIYGVHIHRRTGALVTDFGVSSLVKCIRMRPPVPWYARGFHEDLKTTYAVQDRLNPIVVRLQRWWARKMKARNEANSSSISRWTVLVGGVGGLFDMLGDDLIRVIVEWMLRVTRPRLVECEFGLPRPDIRT